MEAFYDSTARVAGLSPGADEAIGAATLLQLARGFKERPPERTVLLVATSGHAQALAGLRELVWALTARSKDLRDARTDLRRAVQRARAASQALAEARFDGGPRPAGGRSAGRGRRGRGGRPAGGPGRPAAGGAGGAAQDRGRPRFAAADAAAAGRARPRPAPHPGARRRARAAAAAELAQLLRRDVGGRAGADGSRWPRARATASSSILADLRQQLRLLESAVRLRGSVQEAEIVAALSLHLSSHGDGFGAFNYGWLYPLRPRINRVPAYAVLEDALQQAAPGAEQAAGAARMFKDTLRPSQTRSWQTYFLDKPALGGEVFALAGIHGVTLATTGDARSAWGTPADTPERVDLAFAARQAQVVCGMIEGLSRTANLRSPEAPRNGFSTISGRAKFLRQGELFADKPAPGTVLLGYQGQSRFYSMVDPRGRFSVKGVADKTHSFYKVVLEGYRFDPQTGEAVWVIDKKLTAKDAYRVRMNRRSMESDLVMFAGKGTTALRPARAAHLPVPDQGRRPGRAPRGRAAALVHEPAGHARLDDRHLLPRAGNRAQAHPVRHGAAPQAGADQRERAVADRGRVRGGGHPPAAPHRVPGGPRHVDAAAAAHRQPRAARHRQRAHPTAAGRGHGGRARAPRRPGRPRPTTASRRRARAPGRSRPACTTTWRRPRRTSSTACSSTSRCSCRSPSAWSGCSSPTPTSTNG